jgi:pilus assembly protein Flp/PilA
MKDKLLSLYITLYTAMRSEEGQDLIEYALIVALIAFAAVAGMNALATGINGAFQSIATTLGGYLPSAGA